MSLTVKQLNGDTTFLLTFSAAASSSSRPFTVLVDPWLTGVSKTYHPRFAAASHVVPPCIVDLSQLLPPPDVVVVSQDKTDHCHRDTLCQLRPDLRGTTILAHPAAAKKIRGWRYFDDSRVHALLPFSDADHDTVVRFRIPSSVPAAAPAEATFALLKRERDVTGLHSAVGITYRPPVSSPPLPSSSLPPTPPGTPPSVHGASFGRPPSCCPAPRSRTLSVIYAPHGIPYAAVRAYSSSHLVATAALPLTLLLHSFDRVDNPWYLGGNISAGMPGGLEIARNLLARCWIGAHDEDKKKSGLAVRSMCTRRWSADEVRELLDVATGGGTDVRALASGEEVELLLA